MLSNILVGALTLLNSQRHGAKNLAPDAIEQAWQTVEAALLETSTAKAAASRAAQVRRAENPSANVGRPATIFYTVAMGSLWEVRVLGAAAALEVITKTLAENPGNGRPPTAGSMSVQLSRSGFWSRHLNTDSGEHGLTVSKARVLSGP